jgi:Ni,Fe-hydrogenase III large subunit
VAEGGYPALSPTLPVAELFERMIHDLWGRAADGAGARRPWLDHGHWPQSSPLAVRPEPPRRPYEPADPPTSELMQWPLGPVWGRIAEAAQLHLTLDGNAIVSAACRLGFTHKGSLALVRGKPPRTAARYAARLSGDATVAHAVAFATAVEAALSVTAPPRAAALRIVMLEIERIAGHLDTLAEVARLAGAEPVHVLCGRLREHLVRAAADAFGHRLMMDCVVPGGVALDIKERASEGLLRVLGDLSSELPLLRRLQDGAALSARLTGLARSGRLLAGLLGAGGVVGRAGGRRFDARAMTPGYAALGYDGAAERTLSRPDGDAASRQHLRINEIAESMRLVSAALDGLPAGALTVALPAESGEGIGCAESLRGDVWHWLRLDHGQVAGWFPRDPGWALWPLAERVMPHMAAEDADLVRASFALPASGMDL